MHIKLNNKELEVSDNKPIIEIARQEGYNIPSLCYGGEAKHKSSCMLCVVKDCKSGKIIPSCTTFPTEGMEIETDNEEIKALRTTSLELLLSDHIAVCRPPCEPKSCSLRKLATEYHAKWNRYPRYSATQGTPPQHIKDNFWFDVTKCIRCGLCVYNSQNGFTFAYRGYGMQIVLPEENKANVNESLAEICPSCALYIQQCNI